VLSRALCSFSGERRPVPRRVKDFIDISEYTSLDDLIRYLETIRDNLPPDHQAELKIRGDEIFGQRLTITYFRELTPEELELESKYSADDSDGDEIERLRHELDDVPFKKNKAANS
jgi:phage-related protein